MVVYESHDDHAPIIRDPIFRACDTKISPWVRRLQINDFGNYRNSVIGAYRSQKTDLINTCATEHGRLNQKTTSDRQGMDRRKRVQSTYDQAAKHRFLGCFWIDVK
ncbi:hypothetical protein KBK24_0119880 [Burkholderia sp. K24]|nr:hypothetical protein KBK24_0119880 [Burkholderia sp. K24]